MAAIKNAAIVQLLESMNLDKKSIEEAMDTLKGGSRKRGKRPQTLAKMASELQEYGYTVTPPKVTESAEVKAYKTWTEKPIAERAPIQDTRNTGVKAVFGSKENLNGPMWTGQSMSFRFKFGLDMRRAESPLPSNKEAKAILSEIRNDKGKLNEWRDILASIYPECVIEAPKNKARTLIETPASKERPMATAHVASDSERLDRLEDMISQIASKLS